MSENAVTGKLHLSKLCEIAHKHSRRRGLASHTLTPTPTHRRGALCPPGVCVQTPLCTPTHIRQAHIYRLCIQNLGAITPTYNRPRLRPIINTHTTHTQDLISDLRAKFYVE